MRNSPEKHDSGALEQSLVYGKNPVTELLKSGAGVDTVLLSEGLPDAVGAVWPLAIVQTCVVHLLRNTFRYASKKDWDAIKRDVKPIYTAPRSAGCGWTRGNGSYRSWTMTWRSGA